MTQKIFKDSRANRDHNLGFYNRMCVEYANKVFGQNRAFGGGTMSWDYYTSTSWRRTHDDIAISVYIDFNTNTVTVTAK